jgi:hypothetical protein
MDYTKAGLAIVVSILGALTVALGSGNTDFSDISAQKWIIAALAVVGSGGLVWWTENGPYAPTIKAIIAFLSAGLSSLVIALEDNHINQAEWLTALSAAVLATGLVYQSAGPMHTEAAPQLVAPNQPEVNPVK